ncbi:MAG TPA: DUF3048 domain-containing protein [Jiangellales bacterium]|nr:DUF3048 domain-containing protein [Jiangellales bacterium]
MAVAVDRRRGALLVVLVVLVAMVAVSLALVLRSGPGPAAPVAVPEPTTQTATPGPAVTVARAPLTGLPVDDPRTLEHPAVAIKVSDVRQAHPQVGVERADIVFVEPIGVAYTRLAAVFHSDVPDRVGPVRSVRPTDAALLSPMKPVFGNTMAAEWVMRYVDEVADLDNLGSMRAEDPDAYVVDQRRPRPDHVFADPQVLLAESARTAAPEPYFSYAGDLASSSAGRSGAAGTSVQVPYGPGWEVTWTYDEATGRYRREQPWGPHVTAGGVQVSAVNVLVVEVETVTEKLAAGAGAAVPVQQLVDGSGGFVALTGGHSVRGTWRKGEVGDPFELVTSDGEALTLAPGITWVELPAPSAGVTVR